MDWKQELLKRLDAVASKLGQGGAYLWHILARQGIAEGIADSVMAVALLVAARLFFKAAKHFYTTGAAAENRRENIRENNFLLTGLAFAGLLATGIFGLFFLRAGIMYLANPEFYGIERLLDAMGK